MQHECIGPDFHIVTDLDVADDYRPHTDGHIVADGGIAVTPEPHCHTLIEPAMLANGVGTDAGAETMLDEDPSAKLVARHRKSHVIFRSGHEMLDDVPDFPQPEEEYCPELGKHDQFPHQIEPAVFLWSVAHMHPAESVQIHVNFLPLGGKTVQQQPNPCQRHVEQYLKSDSQRIHNAK